MGKDVIYVNNCEQADKKIWFDEKELRHYFLPYTTDIGKILKEDVSTEDLIEAINTDCNAYNIFEDRF